MKLFMGMGSGLKITLPQHETNRKLEFSIGLGHKNDIIHGYSEIEPHGVYILNSECTLFELKADSDQSSSFIIIIIHHASCVMCHASCVMTCWRPSMCFSHSNPKLYFRSELTQPQPHSYGFLRRLYYSFFITL